MTAPILTTRGVCKRLGGLLVSDDISIDVMPGELHAIIGPNGAGKTTLLNQIGGQLIANSGTITFDGTDITSLPVQDRARLGIGRTFQVPKIFPSFTAMDNPAIGVLGRRHHTFGMWTHVHELGDLGAQTSATHIPNFCPMATGVWSRSRPPSRDSRACCCSTSRWLGSGATNPCECPHCSRR